jgi:hypothetical protein
MYWGDEKCIQNCSWKDTTWETYTRWEVNIKIDLREFRFMGVGWVYLAQDMDWLWALVNVVMNLLVS